MNQTIDEIMVEPLEVQHDQQAASNNTFLEPQWRELNRIPRGRWINSDHPGAKVWQAKVKARHEYYNQEDVPLEWKEQRGRAQGEIQRMRQRDVSRSRDLRIGRF